MGGNSKYLRWAPLYTCCCVFVILSTTVIAVPVRPRRMIRETYSSIDTINSNTISNVTCLRDGVEVQKSSVNCEIKTGCRRIQKTGECCPEYQCDCNYEDRTYGNGEKILNPNPCRRCLCKGGEVTCNEVQCYAREDCKPRWIKGVCCPQYDNCPPIDDVKIVASKEGDSILVKPPKSDVILSLTTTTMSSSNVPSIEPNLTVQFAETNPLGIKIKEITKPEEIRITDDKPKPFVPTKSTTPATTTTTTTTTTEGGAKEVTTESTTELTSTTTVRSDAVTESAKALSIGDLIPPETVDYMDDGTTVEDSALGVIAPPTKATEDGEVEPEVFLTNADSNTIGDESSNKSVRQTTQNSTEDEQTSENVSESFVSSTTENEIESNATDGYATSTENDESVVLSSTPKNVVFVRQDGKMEFLQVFGADGLERGDLLDVASSTTESGDSFLQSVEQSTLSVSSTTEDFSSKLTTEATSSEKGESFDDAAASSKTLDNKLQLNDSSMESTTTDSQNEAKVESSSLLTDTIFETRSYSGETSDDKTTAPPSIPLEFETKYYEPVDDVESQSMSSSSEISISTPVSLDVTSESVPVVASSSVEPQIETSSQNIEEEEINTPLDNPERPHLPDDLSIHPAELQEDELKARPSKVVEEIVPTTFGPAISLSAAGTRSGEISTTIAPPLETGRLAPGEPLLIPEWERSTTEKAIIRENGVSTTVGPQQGETNVINKTTIFDKVVLLATEVNKTNEKLASSSSSEEDGRKEPTTERPTTKGYTDIDDSEYSATSSASSLEVSPKDDAESIKVAESAESEPTHAESYKPQPMKFFEDSFKSYFNALPKVMDEENPLEIKDPLEFKNPFEFSLFE